ncbi:hypothetical protein B0J15DRAFT_509944 [Fusarium solani]|uniref:Amine oxidase n=1 Tax=Fusarium solani TaxID=169388 RepID=A0A9P9KT34_FUSSL|nr:uncharacterized protein B0J15DRAFT_509944 [Fusarium solani]KAH7267992.1 hypothetical protein B0J15DRAFT_509944 [Fusarium solani]
MSPVELCNWNPQEGFKTGVPTDAVILPKEFNVQTDKCYDAIVIGAGYAGLRALRDLSTQGYKTILLEGRDRIGGRSWTVKKDGYVYEVGGTWVHRNQAQVWTEIERYGFANRLKDSQDFYEGSRTPTINRNGKLHQVPWTDQAAQRGFDKFCGIDGQNGVSVFDLNSSQWLDNESFIQWDNMSCQDRLDQIQSELTPEEHEGLLTILCSMSKLPASRPSFAEVLRWVALSGGTLNGLGQHAARWKLADGQTALARAIFDDARASGNLSYKFCSAAAEVKTADEQTTVTTHDDQTFKARHVVVAVPLNCLKDITFEPGLEPVKAEAIGRGQTNDAYKVCVEASGKEWRNWSGHAFPDKGIPVLIGDGITPSGNTYLITTPGNYINPSKDPEKLLEALQYLHPDLKIERLFGCDYFSDPFSKGGWAVHEPGFVTKYLKSLQAPAGNVHFANADWANLWRGFIDGALESGSCAAAAIHKAESLRLGRLKF